MQTLAQLDTRSDDNVLPMPMLATAADVISARQKKTSKQSPLEIANQLIDISASPEKMQHTVESLTRGLDGFSSAISQSVQVATANMIGFLASKAPRSTHGAIGMPDIEPSQVEINKFKRYLDAVKNPTSILSDAENGMLTPEAVEAVRAVYPSLFSEIQTQIADRVNNADRIPYKRKLQISMLLGQDMSGSQNPQMARLAQVAHGSSKQPPPQRQQQMPVSRAQGLNMSGRAGQETAAWRYAQKDYGR